MEQRFTLADHIYYTKFPNLKNLEIKKTCFSLPHYIYLEIKQIYIKSFFFFQRKKRTVIVQL